MTVPKTATGEDLRRGSAAGALPLPSGWSGLRDLEREAAITALFDRQYPELVRLAVLLGAEHEAEDVVAEAFCELYRRWPRLRACRRR